MTSPKQHATDSDTLYQASTSQRDEAFSDDGDVREHWQYLLEGLNALGPEGLADRQLKVTRILRDDGATYNVHNDPQISQTWKLDPVPQIIDSEEWSRVETGLRERAELLNLVLTDLYGDRELLKYGVIPPELLFSHAGYLRPCYQCQLPGEHQLIFYATDMVRDADGEMCVISDRTQTPNGAGYALENRTVISRVLPSLFRDSDVHRLSLFFRSLRRKLTELSPRADLPRVVLLTPGPYSRNYFEQAYLANYLGFPLVQGSDLTVHNGQLWLKALDGLSRVDVVLRGLDDLFCDPVELKGDSLLGVPGILEVARNGRVAIANPLGSGVLEGCAFNSYLPAIAQHFMGRELRMKSARSYWCGNEQDRRYVLEHLSQLVIKRVADRPTQDGVFGCELAADSLDTLRRAIEKYPLQFVAQEMLPGSTTPTLVDGQLQPGRLVLRSFAVASESSYAIMPGGLSRAGSSEATLAVDSNRGATSKDTWILASEPEKQLSLRPQTDSPGRVLDEHDTDIPSRVVENLFWFARYAERSEFCTRLMRTAFMLLNGTEPLPTNAHAQLLRAITIVTATQPGFTVDAAELFDNPEPELLSIVLDHKRPGSITTSLLAMLRAGEEIKELLSNDTQRIINDIRDELGNLNQALQVGLTSAPEEALDPLVTDLLALSGLAQESMVRGVGWRFLEMGRRLERAQLTVSLLKALLVPQLPQYHETTLLQPALVSLESVITYRRRFRAQLNIANGLELLLLDRSNPRSLLFQLEKMEEHLAALPANRNQRRLTAEGRTLLEARTQLQLSDLDKLATVDASGKRRAALDQLLSRINRLLLQTADLLADRFFDHAEGPQSLVRSVWEDAP